jgi:hypothetical protein
MIKLEVGKYYKATNGRKYKCVHDFENKHNLHFGRFLCATDGYNGGSLYRFHTNGKNDNTYCGVDLISEWIEHEVDVLAYDYKGLICLSHGAHLDMLLKGNYDKTLKKLARFKIKFTEGEGL